MQPVVIFDNVSKKFRRGERHDSLRDLVPSLVRRATGRGPTPVATDEDFWALRDVSFEVKPGEALGIIGPNGAGKSTALKLLTRILRPTKGSCMLRGRTGALIEVAAGFHPDLTGRENVYLQGAIMGMKSAEVARKLDAIVDFAGVSAFIDTPVKRYSSGMNARLGFAIAAHLDPDILVIDEVLSVGDMAFQERCINRMLEFKRQGAAIVFVSHNLQAVAMLCERAVFLQSKVIAAGEVQTVLQAYVRHGQESKPTHADEPAGPTHSSLESVLKKTEGIPPGTRMSLRVSFRVRRDVGDVTFAFVVHRSTDLLPVYNANFTAQELGIQSLGTGDELVLEFQFNANVVRGMYHVECVIVDPVSLAVLNSVFPLGSFSIDESRTWSGVADLAAAATANMPRSTSVRRDYAGALSST